MVHLCNVGRFVTIWRKVLLPSQEKFYFTYLKKTKIGNRGKGWGVSHSRLQPHVPLEASSINFNNLKQTKKKIG